VHPVQLSPMPGTRYFINFLFIFCLPWMAYAQTKKAPLVRFSFNDHTSYDDIAHLKAKLVGVNFTADRFGNDGNAVFVSGGKYSYINLGNDPRLKQKNASISMWIRLEHKIWSGIGVKCNPLILTKYTNLDDFYESYGIYYMLETGKLVSVATKDSTRETAVFGRKRFERNQWCHVVMTYDYDFLALYIDGELQGKQDKKYETKFISTDSVLVGSLANKINDRFLNGVVDDIEFYDYVLSPDEVSALYHAPNPNRNMIILNWVLVCVTILAIVLSGYAYIRFRIRKAVQKEKERLELDYKLLETELRVNRASMNPHFLFNSLNTLHSFILEEELLYAGDYLVKFSKLIRKTLESNMHESISLKLEIELLERYLEIENMRFEENIKYTFMTNDSMRPSVIHIPNMMLQPFLENAIWHGLLKKEGEKIITVSFSVQEEKYLYCEIEDNGTGRRETGADPVEKTSMATGFILQRLELLNKIYHLDCTLEIEDKPHHTGTIIKLTLPILKN
jgi:two-component sensor histidine kinase